MACRFSTGDRRADAQPGASFGDLKPDRAVLGAARLRPTAYALTASGLR